MLVLVIFQREEKFQICQGQKKYNQGSRNVFFQINKMYFSNPHLNCVLIALLIRNQKSLCIRKVSVVQETKPIINFLFIVVAKFVQVLLFCSFVISTNQWTYSLVRDVVYILNLFFFLQITCRQCDRKFHKLPHCVRESLQGDDFEHFTCRQCFASVRETVSFMLKTWPCLWIFVFCQLNNINIPIIKVNR